LFQPGEYFSVPVSHISCRLAAITQRRPLLLEASMHNAVRLFSLLAVAASVAAPAAAQAPAGNTPNFLGTSGLLFAPSAYTVGRGHVAGHAHWHSRFSNYGVIAGPVERLEIGVSFFHPHGCACSNDSWLLNAKFNLLPETIALPAISVGVVDAFNELRTGQSWYVVASKDLGTLIPGTGLRGHLGYGGGALERRPLAGIEMDAGIGFVPGLATTFIAEYAARDFNLGLRGRFAGFGFTVGLFDFSRFGGGITYTTPVSLW
jgi:hypothetical protein